MKKLVVVAAGLGILALAVGPAIAGSNGAKKATLFSASPKRPMGNNCDRMQMGTTDQGFVVFNLPGQPGVGNGTVIVEASLKGGTSNATFDVYLKHGSSCDKLANPLSTNGQGNGNAHNTASGGTGMYQGFLVNQANNDNAYISVPIVTLN